MKDKYKYVKNMLSQDLVNFLTNYSLQNMRETDRVRNVHTNFISSTSNYGKRNWPEIKTNIFI